MNLAAPLEGLRDDELAIAERLALLEPDRRAQMLDGLDARALDDLTFDWGFWGRPDQQWPDGDDWDILAYISGRGSGKTRSGAENTREAVKRLGGPDRWFAFVAPTPFDARAFMIDGEAGIKAVSPPSEQPEYEPAKRQLTWPNGTKALVYTGADPDSGRGPTLVYAWIDELAKFRYMQSVFDNVAFAMRDASVTPKTVITTTPKPFKLIKDIIAGEEGRVIVRRTSTYRNIANLAPAYIRRVVARYEGTRIGAQELHGEILDRTEGALWELELIEATRVKQAPPMLRIVVGVDPSNAQTMGEPGMGRECGIVVAGLGSDRQGYVLDDRSLHATPGRWGAEAVLAAIEWKADALVVEMNFGGAVVMSVVRTVLADLQRIAAGEIRTEEDAEIASRLERAGGFQPVRVIEVNASRGKKLRAEPIVGLYEQRRIHHVGLFPLLEQQMSTWVPAENDPDGRGTGYSPDRIDACVWSLSALMFGPSEPATLHRPRRIIDDPLRRRG